MIDYSKLLPLIVMGCAPVFLILMIVVYRNHRFIFGMTVLSLLAFLGCTFYLGSNLSTAYQAGPMLLIDRLGLFYLALFGSAGLVITILSYPYFSRLKTVKEEYYVLLTAAIFGTTVLVVSANFASLFLGLEILSVCLYVLIAYMRNRLKSLEAGVKYLILAAASSAFLLFGMALIYVETGSLALADMGALFQSVNPIAIAGLALMLVGIGFKLAVVPFHLWTPDVYEGAPAPVSALIASISKGSVIVILLRIIYFMGSIQQQWLLLTFTIIAIVSMLFGNILALRQNNIKRLLAYSSIAHLGYLLVGVLAQPAFSNEAVTFYLVAYFIAIVGSFGTLSLFANEEGELEKIEELKGMFWKRPLVAAIFSVLFFSLVGIPLTAGFIGKFYLVSAGIRSDQWLLAIVLVLSSAIGVYYYLRVIVTMLSNTETEPPAISSSVAHQLSLVVLVFLSVLTLWLGVLPSGMMGLVEGMGF